MKWVCPIGYVTFLVLCPEYFLVLVKCYLYSSTVSPLTTLLSFSFSSRSAVSIRAVKWRWCQTSAWLPALCWRGIVWWSTAWPDLCQANHWLLFRLSRASSRLEPALCKRVWLQEATLLSSLTTQTLITLQGALCHYLPKAHSAVWPRTLGQTVPCVSVVTRATWKKRDLWLYFLSWVKKCFG